jgi:hypothetical protein
LSKYAFEATSATVSREALRCLANALLLKTDMRVIFVDLGNGSKVAEKLRVRQGAAVAIGTCLH